MNPAQQTPAVDVILWKKALSYAGTAALSFNFAYAFHACGFLIVVYLWSLLQLTRLATAREALYIGLGTGMLCYAPQAGFFWHIFGPAAIALWMILSLWLGIFLILGRSCRICFGNNYSVLFLPFIWTGLEYFRSELYYLRFSWLNAGYVFSEKTGWMPLNYIGMYGVGFVLMTVVCLCSLLSGKHRIVVMALLFAILGVMTNTPRINVPTSAAFAKELNIAGVQLEFPDEMQVPLCLDQLVKRFPQTDLAVLSEYTFTGPVPESIRNWCRKNHRYLIVGGEDPVPDSNYYNTAFVIGPDGDIIFRQGKTVPIQFFKDGLPAREQKLWNSPWGKIGLCVCYDLSYTRVTDELVRQGAQAIIVPTMDVVDWGAHQHELHARVAPIRAAEYGVPIFRVASSGISQYVDATGRVLASAPMPGNGERLYATMRLGRAGSLPWDRVLAPICVGVTGIVIAWLSYLCFTQKTSTITQINDRTA